MTVGLPGTGIGGLFYILLCGFMPFFHSFRALRGGHRPHHLRIGFFSTLLSAGILFSLYGEAKLLFWLAGKIDFGSIQTGTVLANADGLSNGTILVAISPILVALPFIIIFTLLVILQILRLVFHGFKRKPQVQQKPYATLLDAERVA